MNYVKISKCNKSNICVCFYLLEDANKILHEVTEEDWNTLKLCSNVFKVSFAFTISVITRNISNRQPSYQGEINWTYVKEETWPQLK